VLRHCSLGNRRGIWLVKTAADAPKGFLLGDLPQPGVLQKGRLAEQKLNCLLNIDALMKHCRFLETPPTDI